MNSANVAYLKPETIQNETGLGKTGVYDSLAELEQETWIVRDGNRIAVFDNSATAESDSATAEKFSATAESYIRNTNRVITDSLTECGEAGLKITGVKRVSEDDDLPRVKTKPAGLATGVAAKFEKQKEKRTALTPDAEAMADRLDALNGVTLSRTGKDRDRWIALAKQFPGAEGIELVEAAFRNFQEHPWTQWDGPCTAFRVEHFAPTWKFKNKKPKGRTVSEIFSEQH